ncbi:hypothetical protein PF006_g28053 [Phytophthora fragariae]|uniref:Uncharacterized protein n=1 Tax=Phytophthora fragariae TaxID=53985 RepID=A0A6A3QIW5_9STRA|nr:hypothetical protein PF006_g28053 [Phytophthora fragariae]
MPTKTYLVSERLAGGLTAGVSRGAVDGQHLDCAVVMPTQNYFAGVRPADVSGGRCVRGALVVRSLEYLLGRLRTTSLLDGPLTVLTTGMCAAPSSLSRVGAAFPVSSLRGDPLIVYPPAYCVALSSCSIWTVWWSCLPSTTTSICDQLTVCCMALSWFSNWSACWSCLLSPFVAGRLADGLFVGVFRGTVVVLHLISVLELSTKSYGIAGPPKFWRPA